MPLPLVAIVAEDARLPPEARSAIVTSCARAAGDARCVGSNDELAPAAGYIAVIAVAGAGKLHVALQRPGQNVAIAERDLVFASESFGAEHWNSVGLVVAALVADAEPPSQPSGREPPAVPARAAPTRMREVWARVDVAGVAAPGFTFDPWRFGAETKFAFGVRNSAFYPVLSARLSRAHGQVRAQDFGAALGAGARLIQLDDRLALCLELAAVLDTLSVSASAGTGSEESFRTRYGARLSVTSIVKLASSTHLVLGAEGSWLTHRAALELNGKRLGAEARYVPGFTAGFGVDF